MPIKLTKHKRHYVCFAFFTCKNSGLTKIVTFLSLSIFFIDQNSLFSKYNRNVYLDDGLRLIV